jgi:HEAT repeat protein
MYPFGRSKIAKLVQKLQDRDALKREDALLALIEMDLRGSLEVAAALHGMIENETELPALRLGAVQALVRTGDIVGVMATCDVFLAPEQDPQLRWRTVGMLSLLANAGVPTGRDLIALIERATRDREPIVRLHAASNLADLDPGFDAFPIIAALVDDPDESIRVEAVRALTSFDFSRAEPALRKAQQDSSEGVRATAEIAVLMAEHGLASPPGA